MNHTGSVGPINPLHVAKPLQQITITLTDAGGDSRPVIIRLRQLLKLSLRGFRLRCLTAVDSTGKAVAQ